MARVPATWTEFVWRRSWREPSGPCTSSPGNNTTAPSSGGLTVSRSSSRCVQWYIRPWCNSSKCHHWHWRRQLQLFHKENENTKYCTLFLLRFMSRYILLLTWTCVPCWFLMRSYWKLLVIIGLFYRWLFTRIYLYCMLNKSQMKLIHILPIQLIRFAYVNNIESRMR